MVIRIQSYLKRLLFFFSLLLFSQINLIAGSSEQEDVVDVVGAKEPKLMAKIVVPYNNSLVRGDVPVWGLAYGKDFKEYILEYGYGKNPRKWIMISKSTMPKKDISKLSNISFDMVKTVTGNLGLWQTGLDEYEYPNHTKGLEMGDYTLRLTVFGYHGKISSKIMVSVGRVALNCMDNIIKSRDGKAEVLIPAFSLKQPAGLFFIDSLTHIPRTVKKNRKLRLRSKLYRIKPAGERFLQPVILKLYYDSSSRVSNEDNLAIWVFNPRSNKWEVLDSSLVKEDNAVEARIPSIMSDFAVYGVFETLDTKQYGEVLNKNKNEQFIVTPILCFNNFEQSLGEWKNKLNVSNIDLRIVKAKDRDNHYLRVENISNDISFSCVAYSKRFDVRTYRYLEFDYNVQGDVKVDIFLKVGNSWIDVPFLDDRNIYWDVNVQQVDYNIEVLRDGRWHHVRLNLYDLIKKKTDNFYIDEIMFADLDAIGFKKLQFGRGHRGKYFLIDNLKISSSQYFWRIAREYFNNVDTHTDNRYITKVTDLGRDINIKFNVPEMFINRPYHLQIKFRTPIDDKKQIAFFFNDSFRESNLSSSYCIDLILNRLKKGENSITIKNIIGLLSKLEYVALYPIRTGRWQIDSYYLNSRLHYKPYLFIDEIVLDDEKVKGNCSLPECFDIFFYIQNVDSDFLLSIVPAYKNFSPLLYGLSNNISVSFNNMLLKKRMSREQDSNSNISFVIHKTYIKNGINRLRFRKLTHSSVLLNKIKLTPMQ